jgi:hypothetical protein
MAEHTCEQEQVWYLLQEMARECVAQRVWPHTGSPVNITVADGTAGATKSISTTTQQELDQASAQLMMITQPPPPTLPKAPVLPRPVKCPPGQYCQQ